jgi:hypothetical protein
MCLRTISEYKKRSPQIRHCHWSREDVRTPLGAFWSSLGCGIFKPVKSA